MADAAPALDDDGPPEDDAIATRVRVARVPPARRRLPHAGPRHAAAQGVWGAQRAFGHGLTARMRGRAGEGRLQAGAVPGPRGPDRAVPQRVPLEQRGGRRAHQAPVDPARRALALAECAPQRPHQQAGRRDPGREGGGPRLPASARPARVLARCRRPQLGAEPRAVGRAGVSARVAGAGQGAQVCARDAALSGAERAPVCDPVLPEDAPARGAHEPLCRRRARLQLPAARARGPAKAPGGACSGRPVPGEPAH